MLLQKEVNDENLEHQFFTEEQLSLLHMFPVPNHVAIIMDGNRRWEIKNYFSPLMGHWKGAKILTKIVQAACQIGIKVLTVFAFSTENWKRSEKEIVSLMKLFENYMLNKRTSLREKGIRFHTIGDLSSCPNSLRQVILETKEMTKDGERLDLVVAFNYGGRDEIKRAIKKIVDDYDNRKFNKKDITESFVSKYMDTAPWKDPDLLIRTSGELRLSNFLIWQLAYSEIYVTEVLWPDFTPKLLFDAVNDYQSRKRRLGI
jgi:undecaprenyl diphosphate synthase